MEHLANKTSKSSDILRLGPGITAGQIRSMARFCSVAPSDAGSKSRTMVVNMESITLSAQSALLKILEEPPRTATFILYSPSTSRIMPTVLSRCKVVECSYPSYGKQVKDLTSGGMDIQRAAYIASLAEKGYSIDEAPSEQDFINSKMLVDAAKTKDIEMGVNIAANFTIKTITALRSLLVEAGHVSVVKETYKVTNPQDTAILVLNSLVGGKRD